MSNGKEIKAPEELLNDLWEILKGFNILWMTSYIECDPSIYNVWKKRKVLPYKNVKRIVEYMEMHVDDCVTLCWYLMDYYEEQSKKREEKILIAKENNRIRNRERWLKIKEAKNK